LQEARNTKPAADVDHYIDGAINGDADCFGKLYDLYIERVYRHVYYRTGNVTDTEDLTQQVFTKAWKAIKKYKKTSSPFLAWLLKISHNLVIDYYRQKKYQSTLEYDTFPNSRDTSPENSAENRFEQQQLRKTILKLPSDQQQVIMMSFIEGFTYTEIASVLNKREGNIRVILHRALKKMREILEAESLE